MQLSDTDRVVGACLSGASGCREDVLLISDDGMASRFSLDDTLNFLGRTARGVTGMSLPGGAQLAGAVVLPGEAWVGEEQEGDGGAGEVEVGADDGADSDVGVGEEDAGVAAVAVDGADEVDGVDGGDEVDGVDETEGEGDVGGVDGPWLLLATRRGYAKRVPVSGGWVGRAWGVVMVCRQ